MTSMNTTNENVDVATNIQNSGEVVVQTQSPSNSSDDLLVVNLKTCTIEQLIKPKIERLFDQQRDSGDEIKNLLPVIVSMVEKVILEVALLNKKGNQIKTAKNLGINRNTLKNKITKYRIPYKTFS